MKYGRTFNFSAGPAMMPEPVLEEIRDEMMNYRGSGMCVMEMSHRSPVFQQIIDEAEQDLRDLMGIPDNYKVLFIQGGATLQFSMIPMNLMKNGKAVYIETGAWSKKAIAEAKKVGEVIVAASSKDKNYTYVPDCSDLDIPEDTDYVYICENETIHGVTWNKLPNTKGHVLVSDQSSMFLSKPCNVSDYGMIYAGVQKNVGPAGMVVVIVREDLIRDDLTGSAHLPAVQHARRRRLHVQHPELLGDLLLRQGLQVPQEHRRPRRDAQAQSRQGEGLL